LRCKRWAHWLKYGNLAVTCRNPAVFQHVPPV
jgi:hypothetical protein